MWSDSVGRGDALDEDTPRAKQWNQFRDLQEEVDQLLVLPRRRSASSTGCDKRRPLQRPASPQSHRGSGHHRGPRIDHLDSPSSSLSPTQRRFPAAVVAQSLRDPVAELRAHVPFLSSTFHCSDDDALLLLSMVGSGGAGRTHGMDLEDRISVTEAEKRSLELRLEKRNAEIDRLKDELGDARQKLRATQQQASQSSQVLAQKRDEARKQLLLEEGRTQRLQHENKLLHQEIDKLKSRVHQHVMK